MIRIALRRIRRRSAWMPIDFRNVPALTDDESRHDQGSLPTCSLRHRLAARHSRLQRCSSLRLPTMRRRSARRRCRSRHERRRQAPLTSRMIDFHRDIQPIFVKNCYACHGATQARIRTAAGSARRAFAGGDSGPVIIRGHSADSLLIQYVSGQDDAGMVMPPKGKGKRLNAQEIALLKSWIDQGAPWPGVPGRQRRTTRRSRRTKIRSPAKRGLTEHWAFQPVRHVKPPLSRDPWIDTPMDAFVLEKLQQHQLSPNPQANRIDLIRRVTYDLIGLPPTPEAVQTFLSDKSDEAYEHLVDRLLDSRHYGERWARHWLDLARYADSDGFEDDRDRPFAYKYRDYVIRSFNDDKPYNQFLAEQIAGDEIDPGNPDNLIALGFLRNGPTISNQHNEKNRVDEVDDMVSTTSAVCLGVTVGCAGATITSTSRFRSAITIGCSRCSITRRRWTRGRSCTCAIR